MSTLRVTTLNNASNTGTANLTLDASGNATVGNTLVMGSSFKRNRVINGNMAVWQRGTGSSGNLTASPTYVSADRWAAEGVTSSTFIQSTSVPTAIAQYSGKLQRNSGVTNTGNLILSQAFETVNSYDMAGQSATLSFYAKAGANFSASGNTLNFNVFFGQGTDQSVSSMRSNSWTNQTNSGSSVSLTTTWTRYTFVVSVPAGTTQVGMQFYFTATGTAGADDSFYITGVQLEVGSVATPYERQIYSEQLAQCQRYYYKVANYAFGILGFVDVPYRGSISFPVTMRSAPTIDSGATFSVSGGSAGTVGAFNITGATTTVDQIPLKNTAANWTTGNAGAVNAGFNAEL